MPTHGRKAKSNVILANDSGKRQFFWSERGWFPSKSMPGIVPSDEPAALNLFRVERAEQSAMKHVKPASCPDDVRVTFRQASGYDILHLSSDPYFPCKTVGGFIFEQLQFFLIL